MEGGGGILSEGGWKGNDSLSYTLSAKYQNIWTIDVEGDLFTLTTIAWFPSKVYITVRVEFIDILCEWSTNIKGHRNARQADLCKDYKT